jgi:hypothetical protein
MVSLAGSPRLVAALQLYAVLGAPLAWAAQLVLGYGMTQAVCAPPGAGWRFGIHPWEAGLTVAAAAVALGGGAAAAALRQACDGGVISDPLGRVRFVATVGLAVGIIFLALIVFSGAGVLALEDCRR